MSAWHIWLIIAIALTIAEIFTPGFFLACLALAALFAAIMALLGAGLLLQILGFIIATIVILATIRPVLLRLLGSRSEPFPTNYRALIGKRVVVEETIDSRQFTGRVRIGGDSWRCICPTVPVVSKGTLVKVLDVEGNKLIVKPVSQKEED